LISHVGTVPDPLGIKADENPLNKSETLKTTTPKHLKEIQYTYYINPLE